MQLKIATCRKMSSVPVRIESVVVPQATESAWRVPGVGDQARSASLRLPQRVDPIPVRLPADPAAEHGNLRARNSMFGKMQTQGKRSPLGVNMISVRPGHSNLGFTTSRNV